MEGCSFWKPRYYRTGEAINLSTLEKTFEKLMEDKENKAVISVIKIEVFSYY